MLYTLLEPGGHVWRISGRGLVCPGSPAGCCRRRCSPTPIKRTTPCSIQCGHRTERDGQVRPPHPVRHAIHTPRAHHLQGVPINHGSRSLCSVRTSFRAQPAAQAQVSRPRTPPFETHLPLDYYRNSGVTTQYRRGGLRFTHAALPASFTLCTHGLSHREWCVCVAAPPRKLHTADPRVQLTGRCACVCVCVCVGGVCVFVCVRV